VFAQPDEVIVFRPLAQADVVAAAEEEEHT
jgi:hypothetical protein